MPKIRLALFDLGGVLVCWSDMWLYHHVAQQWNIEGSLLSAECEKLLPDLHSGRLNEHEYWQEISEKMNIKTQLGPDKSLINLVFRHKATINRELFPLMTRLKEASIALGILSNLEETTFGILKEWGVLSYFEYVFASFKIGLAKPSPEIYRYVIENVPFSAEEILVIDDKEINVEAAIKEGMRGIVFHGVTALNAELDKILSGHRS